MISIAKYNSTNKLEWDTFVSHAKNGTFLFYRDYMEYHADRFDDFSLMVYAKHKLVALFPANIVGNCVYSHQGLTFGGIIHSAHNTSIEFLSFCNAINTFLNTADIKKVIYKAIPQVYKSSLGDEELYAMFRLNAKLISCNLSSCITLKSPLKVSRNRLRNYKKSVNNGLTVAKSDDYSTFWPIMEENMQARFGKSPVHTCQEMIYLKEHFPYNIELWLANNSETTIAGAVIFKYQNTIKVQYAHASDVGKMQGGIDSIYFALIEEYKADFDYLDFGTSNTENGEVINEGLLNQKESFGARGVIFNTYEFDTKSTII